MGTSVNLVAAYLLGGLTFLPGILFLVCLQAYLTSSKAISSTNSEDTSTKSLQDAQDDGENLKSAASAQSFADGLPQRHTPDVASGYFAVCREYIPGGVNGKVSYISPSIPMFYRSQRVTLKHYLKIYVVKLEILLAMLTLNDYSHPSGRLQLER